MDHVCMIYNVRFCDNALRREEETEGSALIGLEQFPSVILTYTLRAMQFGSSEARQLFPRLLQLLDTYPDIRDKFIEKSRVVPNWMFIQWLSQLVALLDKSEGASLLDALLSVAADYPQVTARL